MLRQRCTFVLAVLILCLAQAAHALVPVRSRGVFTDRDGQVHNWYINGAHTLVWDEKPFVPVGGLFQAKSWAANSTDADYQSDVEALKSIKAAGITDVMLQPARGGITAVKPAAIQKLVDYLDTEGFTYGISLNDGPREPLLGHTIRPGAFRQEVPEAGGVLKFVVNDLASSLYFVVGTTAGDIFEEGEAELITDGVSVTAAPHAGSTITFLLPERIYTNPATIGMCNVWEGFDSYRDSLIALFSQVKLGKGFRFFIDPLTENLAFSDEFVRFMPSSAAFTDEWATWLGRKYKSIESLQLAWAILDREVIDFKEAANLVPLWSGGKGIEWLYDRSTPRRHRVATVRSALWRDLTDFKAESVRRYMNDLAVVLKKTAADVPVVYRSRGNSPLFSKLPANAGFDGIGVEAYGHGSGLAIRTGAYVYSQANEAPKTTWLPVTGYADMPLNVAKETKGYETRSALHADLDWLREIGVRGFYVNGLRLTNPTLANFSLVETPEQLVWLQDYSNALSGLRGDNATQPIDALFYPRRQVASLSPIPLKSGQWWLPSDRAGQAFDFGACGQAYSMDEEGYGVVYYLWNPLATRRLRFRVPKAARDKGATPVAWSTNGEGQMKGDILSLTIGPEPVRLLNFPGIPLPLETFDDLTVESKSLIALAKKQKRLDAGRLQQEMGLVRVRPENMYGSLTDMQDFVNRLRLTLRNYLWLEAEQSLSHSFDETAELPGASGGKVLLVGPRLDNAPAIATYKVNIGDSRPVNVWIAATPGAPLSVTMDGQPLVDEATLPEAAGNTYADGKLVWIRLGVATIPAGPHVLEIRSDGPAQVDAVLFIREEFTPNGATPPPVVVP